MSYLQQVDSSYCPHWTTVILGDARGRTLTCTRTLNQVRDLASNTLGNWSMPPIVGYWSRVEWWKILRREHGKGRRARWMPCLRSMTQHHLVSASQDRSLGRAASMYGTRRLLRRRKVPSEEPWRHPALELKQREGSCGKEHWCYW